MTAQVPLSGQRRWILAGVAACLTMAVFTMGFGMFDVRSVAQFGSFESRVLIDLLAPPVLGPDSLAPPVLGPDSKSETRTSESPPVIPVVDPKNDSEVVTITSFWKPGERWPGQSGSVPSHYRMAVVNVWLGRTLPKHTIQTLHTFSRNRKGLTYILFTDPTYIKSLQELVSGIPGVEVISSFKIGEKTVGLREYIHYRFWNETNEVTGEPEPFKFKLAHNLCDYRPLYGLIFKDYLEEYSHWAWVDKDTFVGNLAEWITASDLQSGEVIGIGGTKARGKVMLSTFGQLAIFRNTRRVNRLMLLDKDLLLQQYKRANTGSANTDEFFFNKLALAGPGRDAISPPLRMMYIVFSTRKRHGALVKPTSDVEPFTLIETSTCFSHRPKTAKDPAGVCRKPDTEEAKQAMRFYRATFKNFTGGTKKVPKAEIECCGWWMGKDLNDEHTGWFKFYRDDEGSWWKRRAMKINDVKLVNSTMGEVIQWKTTIWAHVRTEMCVIEEKDIQTWMPIGHECAQGRIK